MVSLGSRARFRVDDISRGGAEQGDDASTTATRAFTAGGTEATQFAQPGMTGGGTFATRMAGETLPSDIDSAPRGSLEESPVTDSDSFAGIPPPPRAAEPELTATVVPAAEAVATLDDAPTADDPPDEPFQPAQQDAPADFSIPSDDAPTGTDTGLSGGGETVEMRTRQASMDEIFRMKRMLEAKKQFRRKLIGFAMLSIAALVATFVFVTWHRPEKELTFPHMTGTDKLDLAKHEIRSPSGAIDMYVYHPNDPRMKVSETKDDIDVATYTGRDRDAPFRLSFSRRTDRRQYRLSLADSAKQEMDALAKKGYVFMAAHHDAHLDPDSRAGFLFFEQETPQACQAKIQQGTRFFRREYLREEGGVKWHGMMTLLRDRDVVYRLLREVPDDLWPRAIRLFQADPNLILCPGFLRRRWESPGDAALADIVADERLERAVADALESRRTVDWPRITREIDALMVAAADGAPDMRKRAASLLASFRKRKDALYLELENRHHRAHLNGDKADMDDSAKKCQGVFESDPSDLRSRKVFDPKEWEL